MKGFSTLLKLSAVLALTVLTSCSIVDVGNKAGGKNAVDAKSAYADNYNPGANYILAWSDEFNTASLDLTKWGYETGHNFGNAELDEATTSLNNVYISGGNLVIQANRETVNGQPFTSGRINTYGKFNCRYGRVAAKIKMPIGLGVWPAFWMMGSSYKDTGWPKCGEIDIVEMAGGANNGMGDRVVLSTFHWYVTSAAYTGNADYGLIYTNGDALGNDYHIYELEWTPTLMKMMFDGVQTCAIGVGDGDAMFADPCYIILGMGVGGGFWNPAITSADQVTAVMPQKFTIDWVRWYSNTTITFPAPVNASVPLQIYSETHGGNNVFVSPFFTAFNLWGNTCTLTTLTSGAAEGSQAWRITTAGAAGWLGLGISSYSNDYVGVDLRNYKNSYLMFKVRTTTAIPLKVGMDAGGISRWVNLDSTVGYANDGTWHQVRIPIASFAGVNLAYVDGFFELLNNGGTVADGQIIDIDDVYITSTSDQYAPPAGPNGQDVLINCETRTGYNPYSAGAHIDIWGNTMTMAVNGAAAHEGSTGWQFTVGTAGWLGMAVAAPGINCFPYVTSTLKFDIKTTTGTPLEVGVGSADGITTWFPLTSALGYANDGGWHTISIPLNQCGGVNFTQIADFFVLLNNGGATVSGDIINIDNVYWVAASGVVSSSTAPVSSSSAAVSSAASSVASSSGTVTLATIVSATASAVVGGNTAAMSFDGNATGTRWETPNTDPQWIYWDLGSAKPLNSIIIDWETAQASNYTIQGSTDAATWTVLATVLNAKQTDHTKITNSLTGTFRYVRMNGTTRTTGWGYSIWETYIYVGGTSSSVASSVAVSSSKTSTPVVSSSSVASSVVSSSGSVVLATINSATASGNLAGQTPGNTYDNNLGTRWETAATDPQWIYWDLGSAKSLNKITIDWEVAQAGNYTIQASLDAANWTTLGTVANTSQADHNQITTALSGTYRYVKMNGTTRTTPYGYSIWEVYIYVNGGVSSSSAPVVSSSSSAVSSAPISIVAATASAVVGGNTAAMSFDKNTGTRWETPQTDPQWIYWDLGASKALSQVVIEWEAASASNYTIQGSADAATWTTLATVVNTKSMVDHLMITNTVSGTYRYVKMNGTTRSSGYGYSIWEVYIK